MPNSLEKSFPKGMILPRKYLLSQGIPAYTLDNYLRSEKLNLLAKGIYSWKEQVLSAEGFLASLPFLLHQKIWVGGEFALAWQGLSHNISFRNELVMSLYSETHIPDNIKNVATKVEGLKVQWYSGAKIWNYDLLNTPPFQKISRDFEALISSPEMASLELLHLLPNSISFEQADHLLQGLTQLSPRKIVEVLKACKSVKAKRLFFWFANRYQYPWNQYLKPEEFDLGTGKRMIAKQGVLNPHFLITVPKEMELRD
jgi:hypothetical protein